MYFPPKGFFPPSLPHCPSLSLFVHVGHCHLSPNAKEIEKHRKKLKKIFFEKRI